LSASEEDYIDLTNLAKLRIAKQILSDVMPQGVVDEDLVGLALRTVARLAVFLESSRSEEEEVGSGEWPEGPCLKPWAMVPCSLRRGHLEDHCGS
jgi:hypothetical protein